MQETKMINKAASGRDGSELKIISGLAMVLWKTMLMLAGLLFGIGMSVLAASAAAKVVHNTPKTELRRRTTHQKHAVFQAAYIPTMNLEQQDYLEAHNELRESAGMPPLEWDAKLAASAHDWAEKRRGDCDYRMHSSSPYGENIFYMKYREFSPKDVVQWWFSESKMYDSRQLRCRCAPEREGCECGHFLNVVWRDTKRVGCSGNVYCNNQGGVYIVCEYDPPALSAGNPFTLHHY
ncbi:pathogenesis-related protein 1-like isoform X2 [Salvia hispanica]|uniref:pathogenesis-related protein 1-like isoform X2 n=1 Tax=Salvia hispanica TaxID=49212 RepID=UPI0020099998|nr:pathogenesis-related protein 1-like isoform X2 [Salvia hispanica]